MRLLFASEATGWTGGANQIWLTAQELIRRGHEVVVACAAQGELGQRLSKAGVEVSDVRFRQDYDLPAAWRLGRLAQRRRADLIHAHHPRAHAVSLLAAKMMGLRLIVTRRVTRPLNTNFFSVLKYRSGRINRYIAVCDAAADELCIAGVERARIEVIPSGVEMERWEVSREARDQVRGLRPRRVTMVGHYSEIKGHHILLRAAPLVLARLPDVIFQLVGRDTEKLALLARELGIAGNVKILGERKDVPELLAQSHLYVMPSLQEGIGTACIEAHAALVPVVASRVGGLPQVVEDGRTGLLAPPGDERALAESIIRQLDHYGDAEEMSRRAFAAVRETFSLEAVVNRLEAVYRAVAA